MLGLLALKGIKLEGFLKCSEHFSEEEEEPDKKVGGRRKQWEDSACRGFLKPAVKWEPVLSLTNCDLPSSFTTRQGGLRTRPPGMSRSPRLSR